MRDIVTSLRTWADRQPDHPAVVDDQGTTTYGAFFQHVQNIAAAIRRDDIERVLILLPQGARAYAAMFASLLAGTVYAPVNVSAPKKKIETIVAQFGPQAIISDAATYQALFQTTTATLPMIDVTDCGGASAESAPRENPSLLAYVIFTSGSTGVPKGVMIPRTALLHYCQWIAQALNVTPDDRWSQHPNIGFDLSVLDIFGALTNGATLYALNGAKDRLMPADAIRRHKLTIWNSVPSAVNLMRRAGQLTPAQASSVRLWMFCGEPLLPDQVDALFQASPQSRVLNMYGPTEATVSCTSLFLSPADYRDACGTSVALGDPIAGMTIDLRGGPADTEGEIVITGPQLAAGYWNDEAATQDSFRMIDDGGVMRRAYFSGDWAERRGPHLFFKTRIDFQVKISGFRIELDEVAAAIRNCGWPVVCVVKHGEKLAAVIEAMEGRSLDSVSLSAALAAILDTYAIPESYTLIDKMPVNENGKIDMKAVVSWLAGAEKGL